MLERGYMCPDIQQIADSRGMDNDSILDTTLTDGENAENESVDKKRRRSFTYAFKCEVRDEFNRGDISISALARKYTFDRKTMRGWLATDTNNEIPQHIRKRMRKSGAGRKPYYPQVDKVLLGFFKYERERCHTVTYRELRQFLNGANGSGPKINIPLPDGFKASDKYLLNWTKRSKQWWKSKGSWKSISRN